MALAIDTSELRERIGKEVPIDEKVFRNTEATRDNFRHFALAVGDLNPLWHDEEYAARSPSGGLVARPGWLGTVCDPTVPTRGLTRGRYNGQHLGLSWQFHRPVHLGDRFRATGQLSEVVEKATSLGPGAFVTGVVNHYSDKGVLLARSSTTSLFYDAQNAPLERTGSRQPVEPTPEKDVVPPEVAISRVKRRGAEPRFWEDTQIGDELTLLPKGTLTVQTMLFWYIGEHRIRAVDLESPEPRRDSLLRHLDAHDAKAAGVPGLFDIGRLRFGWVTQVVLDWMGDHGVLKEFRCELRRFVYVGDTITCGGRVKNKYTTDGEYLVELDIWAKNHRGEVTAPGSAIVALPTRKS